MREIVGIGACVFDTLISLPHYPKEDTKLRADNVKSAGGGPAATGLVAAAKLGVSTAYIGNLSNDTGGKYLFSDFEKYGVGTEGITLHDGYRSFTSVLWLSAESTSRTCVFDKGTLPPLTLSEDTRRMIEKARVLMVDGNELDAAVEGRSTTISFNNTSAGTGEGLLFLIWENETGLPIDSKSFATGSESRQATCSSGVLTGYLRQYEAAVAE